MFAAVTGDDHVTVPQADAGVLSGAQVGITPVTGKAHERTGELQAVALGNPPCPANVPAGTLLVALAGRLPGELVQSLDALCGETHTPGDGGTAPISCVVGPRVAPWSGLGRRGVVGPGHADPQRAVVPEGRGRAVRFDRGVVGEFDAAVQ